MTTQLLTLENLDLLVQFEKDARLTEPDIFIDDFDENIFRTETEKNLANPLFSSARCLICVDDNRRAIGRIDFAITSTFSFGGVSQAYVDWVYVLKECRHKGAAQFLFSQTEDYLKGIGVNEFMLLMAENPEAQSFYRSFAGAEIQNYDVLRKNC